MAKGIIGKKIGMTQVFDANGKAIAITIVEAGPCPVVQIKNVIKDKYDAVQIGYFETKEHRLCKPELGHLKKHQATPVKSLKEFKNTGWDVNSGDTITVSIFETGEKVRATAVSKGKGFQGVMKRHGFGGGRATHGSHFHRAPGSTGASAYPSRVFPGKKGPGHTGQRKTTVAGLEVVGVDSEKNLLFIKGPVPGAKTTTVMIEAMA